MNRSSDSILSRPPRGSLRSQADLVLVAGLLLALVAGIFFRLLFRQDVEFKSDEAMALLIGANWVQSPHLAMRGMMSSVKIGNPPATVYFFAALFALSRGDPQVATNLTILWNLAGLALAAFWLYAKRETFGRFWTFWILAFVCLSPWAVLYSRKIWAQNLLFPLVVGAVAGFSTVWSERWNWSKAIAGWVCLAVASQVHMSGIVWGGCFVAAVCVLWPPRHRAKRLPFLAVGSAILILLYAPWVVYLLLKRPSVIPPLQAGEAESAWQVLGHLVSLWLGLGWSELSFLFTAKEAAAFFDRLGVAWKALQAVSAAIMIWVLVFASVLLVVRAIRRNEPFFLAALAPALVLFFPLLWVSGVPVYQHYGIVQIWPVALICGFGWREMERAWRNRPWARRALTAGAVIVLVGCAWTTGAFMLRIHATGGTRGKYGTALWRSKEGAGKVAGSIDALPWAVALELRYLHDLQKDGDIDLAQYPEEP